MSVVLINEYNNLCTFNRKNIALFLTALVNNKYRSIFPGKRKGVDIDTALLHENLTPETLRYGTRCKGPEYPCCTHLSANGMNHAFCLPSPSWSSFYRLRRDGRLSRPSWLDNQNNLSLRAPCGDGLEISAVID